MLPLLHPCLALQFFGFRLRLFVSPLHPHTDDTCVVEGLKTKLMPHQVKNRNIAEYIIQHARRCSLCPPCSSAMSCGANFTFFCLRPKPWSGCGYARTRRRFRGAAFWRYARRCFWFGPRGREHAHRLFLLGAERARAASRLFLLEIGTAGACELTVFAWDREGEACTQTLGAKYRGGVELCTVSWFLYGHAHWHTSSPWLHRTTWVWARH